MVGTYLLGSKDIAIFIQIRRYVDGTIVNSELSSIQEQVHDNMLM